MKLNETQMEIIQAIRNGAKSGEDIAAATKKKLKSIYATLSKMRRDGILTGERRQPYGVNEEVVNGAVPATTKGSNGARAPRGDSFARMEKLMGEMIDEMAAIKPRILSEKEIVEYRELKAIKEKFSQLSSRR